MRPLWILLLNRDDFYLVPEHVSPHRAGKDYFQGRFFHSRRNYVHGICCTFFNQLNNFTLLYDVYIH